MLGSGANWATPAGSVSFIQWVWLPDMTDRESSLETDIAGRFERLTVYNVSSTRLEMPSFSKM